MEVEIQVLGIHHVFQVPSIRCEESALACRCFMFLSFMNVTACLRYGVLAPRTIQESSNRAWVVLNALVHWYVHGGVEMTFMTPVVWQRIIFYSTE